MAITTYSSLSNAAPIIAGDTLKLSESLTDYPASTHTLRYVLRGMGERYELTGTASGDTHVFTESSATTGSWRAGDYAFAKYAEDTSGQRVTIDRGIIRIEPNVAVQDPDEAHARKVLCAIRAQIEGRATDGVESCSLGGTSITKMDSAELLRWERVYKRRVSDLEKAAKVAVGFGASSRVQFRL